MSVARTAAFIIVPPLVLGIGLAGGIAVAAYGMLKRMDKL